MKYSVVTFGCRVNQADSMRIEEALASGGAEPSDAAVANLVVVNTCSVTASADQGARQTIRRIARVNPSARIVVTGCYATRRPDDVAALPGVVRVVPNDRKEELSTAERFGRGEGPCGSPLEPGFGGRTVLTLRVQTGCEERCTYCIIPATRGPVRSAPPSRVVNDVALAAGAGYREIVLTGVHLGSYGRDLAPRATLADLLRALDAVRDDVWFRVSSLEPMDCTRDVLDILSSSVRFAPHLHLPLQHGSDPMLAAMGRPYTRAQYARLVDEVRQRLPHAAIGSDVIVGFPGETDADFRESCDYLINSPLTSLHVFPYSDRPGTAASRCEPKVAGPTVRARGVALRELARDLHRRFQLEQIGTVRPALTLEDGTTALTDNYLKVRIPGGRPRNQLVGVLMTGLAGGALEGVPADIASAMR